MEFEVKLDQQAREMEKLTDAVLGF